MSAIWQHWYTSSGWSIGSLYSLIVVFPRKKIASLVSAIWQHWYNSSGWSRGNLYSLIVLFARKKILSKISAGWQHCGLPHLAYPEEVCGLADPPFQQVLHYVPLVDIHRDQGLQGLPTHQNCTVCTDWPPPLKKVRQKQYTFVREWFVKITCAWTLNSGVSTKFWPSS